MTYKNFEMLVPKTMARHLNKVFAGEYDIDTDCEYQTIIDIGANVGAFALWAAKKWENAKIHAYEPHPESFKLLQKNIENAGISDRVKVYNFAIVSKNVKSKTATLYNGINNVGESTLYPGEEDSTSGKTYKVELLPFSKLPKADLIKMDCEGAEHVIIDDIDMASYSPDIVAEIHGCNSEIMQRLHTNGYMVNMQRWTPQELNNTELERSIIKASVSKKTKLNPQIPFRCDGLMIPIEPNRPQVFVGIPVHYNPTVSFSMSILMLEREYKNVNLHWNVGDSHIDRARNNIVHEFLKTEIEWLFFLDSDLQFEPDILDRLISHGKSFVTGIYAKKKVGGPHWCINVMPGEGQKEGELVEPNAQGLYRVREGATGCMIVHRSVIQDLIDKRLVKRYTDDSTLEEKHAVFDSGVYYDKELKRTRWLSEDWAFSHLARLAGYEIWADSKVICKHEGAAMFPITADQLTS